MKGAVQIVVRQDDGIFYSYTIETATLTQKTMTVGDDGEGGCRIVDETDALIVEWPIDQGYILETNDPAHTEEPQP